MTEWRPTPQLTEHARERCAEMGIVTKRVKRVARMPDLAYASRENRRVLCRLDEPDFRVVVNEEGLIVTVLLWTYDTYTRAS